MEGTTVSALPRQPVYAILPALFSPSSEFLTDLLQGIQAQEILSAISSSLIPSLKASSAHLGGNYGHIEPDVQDFTELHLYPKGRQASWPPELPHPT